MDCMSLHIMRYYFSSRFVSSHLYLFYYELFIEWCNLSCNNNFLQASSLHRYGLYMAWILRVFHLYAIEIIMSQLIGYGLQNCDLFILIFYFLRTNMNEKFAFKYYIRGKLSMPKVLLLDINIVQTMHYFLFSVILWQVYCISIVVRFWIGIM